MNYVWKKRPIDKDKEQKLRDANHNKIISHLIAQRNIPIGDVNRFVQPDYNNLIHPHNLKGVKEAAELFLKVVKDKGKVCVSGDYDADGIISSTMIYELCNNFNIECNVFLPSRFEHGYGLSEKGMKTIKELCQTPPDLLFVLDSGINSETEVKALKEWGIKHIIVIDHHIVDLTKMARSADVLINWHLQDDFGETCTCGEVFHFIRGVRCLTKKVNPIEYLSYAALGVLGDISPLNVDNRIIVKNGLTNTSLNTVISSGLCALIKKSKVYTPDITQGDVSFKIVPRINAVGRIEIPDIAFKLLTERDISLAELKADKITDYNNQRKLIQGEIEEQAIKYVRTNIDKYKYGIFVYNPDWPIGILGLVASALVEEFLLPAVVIGKNNGVIKGSGRSLEKVNLKLILDNCSEAFEAHGGHIMAAGVTLKPDYLDSINELFNKACKEYYDKNGYPGMVKLYDIQCPPDAISKDTIELLVANLYPYCPQFNPEPIFRLHNVRLTDVVPRTAGKFKILCMNAIKDGIKTKLKMQMFTSTIGTEISGAIADIYVTLPQSTESPYELTANIVDLIIHKKDLQS